MPTEGQPSRTNERSSLLDRRSSIHPEKPASPSSYVTPNKKPAPLLPANTINWRRGKTSKGEVHAQVEKYDPQRLLMLASVFSWRSLGATVIGGKTVILIGAGYAVVAAIFCVVYILKPVEIKSSLQDTMDALETFLDLTVTGIMLLLGQFVSQTLSRWWDIRDGGIGRLWGAVDDLSMWASAWWPDEGGSHQAARALVLRYGIVALDLLFRQARGEDGPEYWSLDGAVRRDLLEKGLLEPHEAEVLAKLPSKPQVVTAWLTKFWTRVFQDDGLACSLSSWPDPTRFQLVMAKCAEARGAIGYTLMYTDTQLPFSYVHLLAAVTHLTLLANALYSGCTLGRTLHDSQDIKAEGGYDVFVLLVFCKLMRIIFLPLLLVGLLLLGVRTANPLGFASANNFPGDAYLQYMQEECEAFASANRQVSIEHGWWAGCVARRAEDTVPEGDEEPPIEGPNPVSGGELSPERPDRRVKLPPE